jgi:hypothetical protein
MEITGKIAQILEATTGTSQKGEWKRQDFILETQEQYPKKVCIENWNDKIDSGILKVGSTLTVSINLESREFNGKWYTGVKAWKASTGASTGGTQQSSNFNAPPGDIPPPSEEPTNDDLPF